MSEATTANDVLEGVFAVDESDEVHLAVDDYEWANPFEVTNVDHIDWESAAEGIWATREVLIEGGYGSRFSVTAIEGDADLELQKPSGEKRGDLERFEPVGQPIGQKDESSTSTEDSPTSDVDSESEAEPDVLEEDAADDAPATDAGDDVQDEPTSDSGRAWCGRCGQKYVDEDDVRDHSEREHERPPIILESEPSTHLDWLDRDADEIVETSPIADSLEEVLEVVSSTESATFARQQIAPGRPQKVQDLLWELGLRTADGSLIDEPELSDRIDVIREVYVDD